MRTLKRHLRDYLELRRGLGFDLERVESRLRSFLEFMQTKRTRQITTTLALEFALRSDHRAAGTQTALAPGPPTEAPAKENRAGWPGQA